MSSTFLQGTIDAESPIRNLRGTGLVLEKICDEVDDDAFKAAFGKGVSIDSYNHINVPICTRSSELSFPEPKGIVVNMMPFKLVQPKQTLPEYLHPYIDIIRQCPAVHTGVTSSSTFDYEAIAYLTVHESFVKKGETQRRPGIHIEAPLELVAGGHVAPHELDSKGEYSQEYRAMCWGLGCNFDGWPIDGIYMASNVSDSTAIWNVRVDDPAAICDAHGALGKNKKKHERTLRDLLGPPILAKANELHWITDRTPHESRPMAEDTYRQFFRLVVGKVSVWYSGAFPNAVIPASRPATVPAADSSASASRGLVRAVVPHPVDDPRKSATGFRSAHGFDAGATGRRKRVRAATARSSNVGTAMSRYPSIENEL
jgi:hypothetical protein